MLGEGAVAVVAEVEAAVAFKVRGKGRVGERKSRGWGRKKTWRQNMQNEGNAPGSSREQERLTEGEMAGTVGQ